MLLECFFATKTLMRERITENTRVQFPVGTKVRRGHLVSFKKSKETALFKVARGASVARRINIVPEQVNQVDDMLIPRSNRDLFHKLLSAPERVSGTDRGGPPRLFKRSKDTYQN